MSRDPRYQKLLNSKRWKMLRKWKLQQTKGYCEICYAEGYYGIDAIAIDIHHKQPVESARTEAEMERLCFDPNNLQALCIRHHSGIHKEAKSHTKEQVQANKQRARRRFMEANDPNWKPDTTDDRPTD